MNYRHAYHAGNFADVMKHTALVAVLLHLRKKDSAFAVIDTHAGRGLYDLSGDEARKTGEAGRGIARLSGLATAGEPLTAYLDIARAYGPYRYPGSPLIAARLLRPQDRLVAIEKHPDEVAALAETLKSFRKARSVAGDGYTQLIKLLPPPERRGLILLDPPFEAANEFAQIAQVFARAIGRFATGIYLLWFPIKLKSDAEAFSGEILAAGATRLLRLRFAIGVEEDDTRLTETGLLVVNPPYGFDDRMRETLRALAAPLGENEPAKWSVEWLAGGA
jgi:23S rRNA (adenine2030-N6)-methyltransferase